MSYLWNVSCPSPQGTARFVLAAWLLMCGVSMQSQAEPPELFKTLGTEVPAEVRNQSMPAGYVAMSPKQALELPHTPNPHLPIAADPFRSLGYVPFIPYMEEITVQDDAPRAGQLFKVLSMRATPGEYETAALAIYAIKDLKDVKVTISDLVSSDSVATIPAQNVDIRSAFYMPRRAWEVSGYTILPVIMEKRTAFPVLAGQSQLFYLTVSVPQEAAAGMYSARVTIVSEGADSYELEMTLEVLPFTLEDPETVYGFWYNAQHVNKEYLAKDFVAMRGCGMNSVALAQGDLADLGSEHQLGIKIIHDGNQIHFDFSELIDCMAEYRRAGFTRPVIYNVVIKEFLDLNEQQFGMMLQQMNILAKKHDWPGFIWGIGDENDANSDALAKAKELLAKVNRVVPNDQTKQTIVYPENAGVYGNDLDILVWAAYINEDALNVARQTGAKIGHYNGTGTYAVSFRDNRFFYGLWTWYVGAEHVEQWVFNEAMFDTDEPFNDLSKSSLTARRGNCYFYCFPGADGPLPTVGYYGIMEGVDDARYLHTLEHYILRAQESSQPAARYLTAKAKKFTKQLHERFSLTAPPNKLGYFTIRREIEKLEFQDYDNIRNTTTDFIVLLKQAIEPE